MAESVEATSSKAKPPKVNLLNKPRLFRKTCLVIAVETKSLRNSNKKLPQKHALVTTGATASFDSLVRAVLDPNFLKDLRMAGYTNLTVQHGKDKNNIVKEFNRQYPAGCNERHGVSVETFDFKRDGLFQDLMAAQGRDPDAVPGMVITHAGRLLEAAAINSRLTLILSNRHRFDYGDSTCKRSHDCRTESNIGRQPSKGTCRSS